VESALAAIVTQTLYPNGTSQPSAIASPCKAYRGWPIPAQLDADLAAGILNASVFPMDVESRTTRYLPRDIELPIAAPTLSLTVSGTQITVTGTPSSPLNAAAIIDNHAFVYPVQPGDTPNTIATGLAALIDAQIPATSGGPFITVTSAKQIIARIGGVGSIVREIRRQKRHFMISLWCNSPTQRDAAAKAIDAAFAAIDFLSLPDGTVGRLLYERSRVLDSAEKARLYRRDLIYSVEYGTTNITSAAQIVAEILNLTADPGGTLLTTVI
jgi:hypothetical protein